MLYCGASSNSQMLSAKARSFFLDLLKTAVQRYYPFAGTT